MIQRWKILRELGRVGQQLRAAMSWPVEPFQKWWHDRNFYRNVTITPGLAAQSGRYAVFLIYQPLGVVKSTLETCRHLAQNGYSVLLVANSELTPGDRDALQTECWKIAERPNFGYDFGGYRDGVRLLNDLRIAPQALVLLNDSIWWPIFAADSILARMESAGADVVGTIMHQPTRKRSHLRQPVEFLESYFFWFNQRAAGSAGFSDFWRKYRVSSIKYNAVHRGERRLSRVMMQSGMKVVGLFTRKALVDTLSRSDSATIRTTLRYGAFIDAAFKKEADNLLSEVSVDDAWRMRAMTLIDRITVKRGFHSAFAFASLTLLGASFIKKSPGQVNGALPVMRARVLEAIGEGVLPPLTPVVLEEMEKRQRDGASAVGRT